MGASAVALEAVTVSARRSSRLVERAGPGAVGRSLSADQLARLPVEALDLKTIATLAPGVLALAATDSTEADFSVAGQRPTANAITLDGLSLGGGSVRSEERRGGKEGRSRWAPDHLKKKNRCVRDGRRWHFERGRPVG